MLDPQAQFIIDLMVERKVPPVHTLTPQQARQMYRERRFFTQPEPREMAECRDLSCPREGGTVPLRFYRPKDVPSPAPVLLYFHGGGWTIGDLDTHDRVCRLRSSSRRSVSRKSLSIRGSKPSAASTTGESG